MQAVPLDIADVFEIRVSKIEDERGSFSETFLRAWFRENVSQVDFVQENQAYNRNSGTVRGLHYQSPERAQGKLVRCLTGAIFDVAVDIREGSPHFGQWVGVTLTAEAGNQLWVPEGFLHGYCALGPGTVVCYKVTDYYSKDHDAGVAWDDPDIGIVWPDNADPGQLSGKDRTLPRLSDIRSPFMLSGA